MNQSARYVEVILPLPLHATFTYRLPDQGSSTIVPGCRVIVPFGNKKFYTGIVVGLPLRPPAAMEVKEVTMILDDSPVLRHPQLKLWEWMADYYLAAIGDIYKAAIPSGMKIESETFVEANPDFDPADGHISDHEAEILQLLDHKGHMTVAEIAREFPQRGTASLVNSMISRGLAIVSEKLVERYRTKRVTFVRVAGGQAALPAAFAAAKGAPKQETLLLALAELLGRQQTHPAEISRETLLDRAQVSPTILSALVKKGVVEVYKKEVNRFRLDSKPTGQLPRLSASQLEALDQIHKSWKEKDVTLLHGVTASGKTEIYIHLINYVLGRGDQALYLVPEIALTTQLTRRLQQVFGSKVVIYHSKFSDNERVDIWKKLLTSDTPMVVIGARSAVFLPFAKLGLVIVDEEHEGSYKQFDPAPRYNARDTAMMLAHMHGARTLLGSATPAVETYYKASTGKFALVSLTERYGDNVTLPAIDIIDMKSAHKTKEVNGAMALRSIAAMRKSIESGHQGIIFQNRRGYAPIARCKQCAWVPKCDNCDVSLTYHRALRQLKCHYCGATYPLPTVCPQCKEPAIEVLGYGTERVEDETAAIFSNARVARMDLDTTRNKNSYDTIIDDFSSGKSDILVGTQMVTKGLDFAGVETVVVVSADTLINFPDFRSAERAFNMLSQVAGRAGRRDHQDARVIVQTYQPAHPVLSFVKAHDYNGFYNFEITQRQRFCYPPFSRIINIFLRHRDPARLRQIADTYAARLRQVLGQRVFGPEEPSVARIQGLYIRKVMLKTEPTASMTQVKSLLRQIYQEIGATPLFKGATIHYDVDPQ